MFALEAGSFGFQIGGQETDFVLLIMNDSGARSVMSSKVKLGGDASIAAGPVGRDAAAATDIVMKAEILSYSRAQGLFAGVSLEGSTLRSDDGANKALYGQELSAREIVRGVGTASAGDPQESFAETHDEVVPAEYFHEQPPAGLLVQLGVVLFLLVGEKNNRGIYFSPALANS